jgi:hypothetical protein
MKLFQDLKERAKSFISGASSFKIQDTVTAKVVTLVGIIPKKTIPKQLIDKISKPLGQETVEGDPEVAAPKKVVSSLGKLTLDLVQINNNLEKITDIIQEDYKNTKELNKKDTEDYRKRIANRFRTLGKRDYKSNKVDVSNLVKNFAGSFFKGVGGALRALSAFNFIDALMRGDPAGAIGSLLGMAATYIPAIIGGVVGGITASIFGGIKNLFKGGKPAKVPTSVPTTSTKPAGPKKFPGMGKWGKMLALGTSALALGSAFGLANKEEDPEQTRLEQLTQEQKASVEPDKLVPIPQDDLKRFEDLNKRFEKAIEFLLGKQKEAESNRPQQRSGGGPGGSPTPPGPINTGPGVEGLAGFISGAETGGRFDAYNSDRGQGDPRLLQTNISDLRSYMRRSHQGSSGAVGAYQFMPETAMELAREMGMDPSKTKFTPEIQKQLHIYHLNKLGYQDYVSGKITKEEFGKRISQQYRAVPDPRTGYTYADSAASRNAAQVTNDQFLKALEKAKSTPGAAPRAPSLPPSTFPSIDSPVIDSYIDVLPKSRQAPRPIAPNRTPQVIPLPIQPPSPQVPLAGAVDEIDNIPSITTNYSENFLSIYSKLIYQIV